MTHYPFVGALAENEFGIAPYSDTSFLTLLAQNKVPGLSLRTRDGRWIDAPALDGHLLVNGGDMLRRWTNDRFLATPHRASNRSGTERYAIPFFFDCSIDWPMVRVRWPRLPTSSARNTSPLLHRCFFPSLVSTSSVPERTINS